MKVAHVLLDAHIQGYVEVLKKQMNAGDVLVVSPGKELLAQYEAILSKQLTAKRDALGDLKALGHQFKSLSADVAFHQQVDLFIERVYAILCQGMSLSFQDNSLSLFLGGHLVLVCGQCLASMLGVTCVTDGRDLIICESNNGLPVIDWTLTQRNISALSDDALTVVGGAYGRKVTGETIDLGKRGSELTANIIGALLHADVVRFFVKDFDYSEAPRLSYEEAAQCFSGGVPVYPPAMLPARNAGVAIEVAHLERDGEVFVTISANHEQEVVRGISGVFTSEPMSLVTVYGTGLLGSVGISSVIFDKLARKGINIHFISQSLSEYSISFAVKRMKEEQAEEVLKALIDAKAQTRLFDLSYATRPVGILSVYGQGMRNIPGISGKIYTALGDAGINVVAASQGGEELSISIVVEEKDTERAKAALVALKP